MALGSTSRRSVALLGPSSGTAVALNVIKQTFSRGIAQRAAYRIPRRPARGLPSSSPLLPIEHRPYGDTSESPRTRSQTCSDGIVTAALCRAALKIEPAVEPRLVPPLHRL